MSTRNINPVQVLVVFEHFHVRHYCSMTICHSYRNPVSEHIHAAKGKQHKKAFECLADSIDSDNEPSNGSYVRLHNRQQENQ